MKSMYAYTYPTRYVLTFKTVFPFRTKVTKTNTKEIFA